MRIPDQVIAEIAERLDPVEVVSEYVHLTRKGTRYWGLCPFHSEKTPSFSVTPDRSVFYCFGCQRGGSIFNFVMEMESLSFPEAVRLLAEKVGVEVRTQEEGDRQREAYLELYRRVAGSLHYLLTTHARAARGREYLMGRGVSQETIDRFALGYAPADRLWMGRFLKGKGYSEPFLRASGLFARAGEGQLAALFADRVIFPIRNHRDEVIGFGGRSLEERAGPKYLNTPETLLFRKGHSLYGPPGVFRRMRETGRFIVVEGYMDVIALSQHGIEPCVAPLGTALTGEQVRLLKRHAGVGLLLFDGDAAGGQAAERAILACEGQELPVKVVALPEGKDPADVAEKEGPEPLKKAVECSISGFQFLLGKALAAADSGSPDGKRTVITRLTPYLSILESQVKRDGYLRNLAEALQVDFESVRSDFLRYRSAGGVPGGGQRRAEAAAEEEGIGSDLFSDLYVVLAVAVNREYFPEARRTISVEDLEDRRARELFIALEECFREDTTETDALLLRLPDPGLRGLVVERLSSEQFSVNQERVIRDGLRSIRRRGLEKRRSSVEAELPSAEAAGGPRWRELLAEKIFLDDELEKMKVMTDDRHPE